MICLVLFFVLTTYLETHTSKVALGAPRGILDESTQLQWDSCVRAVPLYLLFPLPYPTVPLRHNTALNVSLSNQNPYS